MKHAPELIPYVINGELKLAECIRAIRQSRTADHEPEELTLEEKVERSFKRWLAKWPKEDRDEVLEIVVFIPSAKLADIMTKRTSRSTSTVKQKPKKAHQHECKNR